MYEAIAFAPPSSYGRQRSGVLQPARFDVAVLVETQSPGMIGAVITMVGTPALESSRMARSRSRGLLARGSIDPDSFPSKDVRLIATRIVLSSTMRRKISMSLVTRWFLVTMPMG